MGTDCVTGEFHPVIVRAFDDEPVKMEARRVGNGVHEVFRDDPKVLIGLPDAVVYPFEPNTYESLCLAWGKGDRVTLRRIWQDAKRLRE